MSACPQNAKSPALEMSRSGLVDTVADYLELAQMPAISEWPNLLSAVMRLRSKTVVENRRLYHS